LDNRRDKAYYFSRVQQIESPLASGFTQNVIPITFVALNLLHSDVYINHVLSLLISNPCSFNNQRKKQIMFTTAKLTAMKRRISLPPIVWIGLAIVLGSWQPSALAETDCNAVTEIPKAQCETLIAIYDSTAGDNWTDNTGWQRTF